MAGLLEGKNGGNSRSLTFPAAVSCDGYGVTALAWAIAYVSYSDFAVLWFCKSFSDEAFIVSQGRLCHQ